MTTWIGHLRLADNLLRYGFDLNAQAFLLGSLAPDATLLNTDGEWYPSKFVTHFRDADNQHIQPEDFYESYLRNRSYSPDAYAFLLGYYAHLLADVEWIGNVWGPFKHQYPELGKRIENDTDFAYEFKGLEWFGQDFLYLEQRPDYTSLQILRHIENVTSYIDMLPSDILANWLHNQVMSLYDDRENMSGALAHDFPYLSQVNMQAWLDCTTGTLIEMFKDKHVPCPNLRPLWGAYIQPYA